MRKYFGSVVAVLTVVLATLFPNQSFGAPFSSPGNTQGNGPCLTSGSTNSQTQSTKNTNKSCGYTVGQTGPGGGKIFYVATKPFACGPTLTVACRYLEAAPTSGTNAWTDANYAWSGNTTDAIGSNARGTAIGKGYANTLAIVSQSGTEGKAGTISQAYRGPNGLMDWFLPSQDELNALYLQKSTVGGFVDTSDWSSSESDASFAWLQFFGGGFQSDASKYATLYVRPVRAF